MEYQITLTGKDPGELANILKLCAKGNFAAASTYEAPADAVKQAAQSTVKAAQAAAKPKAAMRPAAPKQAPESAPAPESKPAEAAPFSADDGPSYADVLAVARPLTANGKGDAVNALIKKHGAALLSKVDKKEYPALIQELKEVAGNG